MEPAAETDKPLPSNLDIEEQQLRIEELKLKVADLNKSDWKKIGTWTGLVAILAAIMGIIGQGIVYQIKSAKSAAQLDSLSAKKAITDSAIKKAYIDLNRAKDSIQLIQKAGELEYAANLANNAAAKRTLDSINVLIASSKIPLSQSQSTQFKRLVKETKQSLNTVVQSTPPVLKHSSNVQPQDNSGNNASPAKENPVIADNQNDPQKGKWGLLAERNGRKMYATVNPLSNGLFNVTIVVTGTDPANPLTGTVLFHLHNTFRNPNPSVDVENNEAVLQLKVYGSFTVGAETDNGRIKLELDLALIPGVDQRFKDN